MDSSLVPVPLQTYLAEACWSSVMKLNGDEMEIRIVFFHLCIAATGEVVEVKRLPHP